MSKSEQTGGGGGTEMTPRKEPKPKEKRPWRKPRLHLVEFAVAITKGAGSRSSLQWKAEGADPGTYQYDPNIS